MMFRTVRFTALLAAAVAMAPAQAAGESRTVPKLSSEALAQPPFISQPRLSPDGMRLLARMFVNGSRVLAVVELEGTGLEAIPVPEGNELLTYSWAGSNRIVVTMGALIPWHGRGEKYVTRTFAFDLKTQKALKVGPAVQGTQGDDILWIDPEGKSLLIASQPTQFEYKSIYRVDLGTGKVKLEQGPRDYVWDWYADASGVVRYGIGLRERSVFTFYKPANGGDFDRSTGVDYDDDSLLDAFRIVSGTDDGYALSPKGSGRYALYKYNFKTRQLGEKLYDNPTNDILGTEVDEATNSLVGVRYADDRNRVAWFDPTMKAVQAKLDETFRGKVASIVSRSRDRQRLVVLVSNSNDPGTYYLFTSATGRLVRLGKVAEKVDPAGLSETKYVHYEARDGLRIPAYLTLPVGQEAKGLPLIIMPHGGPYGVRDTLGYDAEVQFLANRGYAVLQPNYRGSDGYGEEFYKKGEGQWGRAMQNDIDDGMDWLVKSGTIDAKRVCIVGASYGGYVALWGATRNPERYRCAVSFAGVSNLKQQLDYQSDFLTGTRWRKDWQSTVKGEKDFDLTSVSPIAKVTDLKVPVMLVHGDADTIVLPKQTTLYDRALTAAGKSHETYVYPGEGHGFDKPANEKDYLDKLEAFLAKHNPAL